MCFVLQLSLSSKPSLPKAGLFVSEGTQRITLPSSPAEARVSPGHNHISYCIFKRKNPERGWTVLFGDHLTTFTACVCFERVARYSTFRSSPVESIFQSWQGQYAEQKEAKRQQGLEKGARFGPGGTHSNVGITTSSC